VRMKCSAGVSTLRGLVPIVQSISERPRYLCLAVFVLALLIYLLIPTKMYYWDGVGFALTIERAGNDLASLFHPNHLIYNFVGYFAWRGLAALNISVRALGVLQGLNAVIAAATVCLVWRVLFELTASLRRATELAALFALSATWWKFATDADAYISSVFFLVFSFWFLLPEKRPRPMLVAALHAVAIVLHQLALLFLPVVLVGISRQKVEGKSRKRMVLRYMSLTAVLTTLSYVYAFVLCHPGNFWQWITTHSTDSSFSFDIPHAIHMSLRGMVRLFFGGKSTFWDMDLITTMGTIILVVTIILFLRSLAPLIRSSRPFGILSLKRIAEEKPLLVWVFIYIFFLVFWLPQNTFYRLFYLPPLIFLAAIPCRTPIHGHFLSRFAAVMLLWNFTFLIYPYSHTEANEVLQFAEQRSHDWPKNTAVAYSDFHSDLWTISYFNPQVSWLSLSGDAGQLEDLHAALRQKGVSLWLEGTVYDALNSNDEGKAWINKHIDHERSIIHRSHAHEIRFFRMRD
jgi:hypothetical protein